LPEAPEFLAELANLFALGRCRSVASLAFIQIGLLDPTANRPVARLELFS
jgi:hypothetical protein